MIEKRFPILNGPSLPWAMVEPCANQVKKNHKQTLKRLAERGGLSPSEMVCALEGKLLSWLWYRGRDDDYYRRELTERLAAYEGKSELADIKKLEKENAELKAKNERLEKFCAEFVWGEENPDEYKTQENKIAELREKLGELVVDKHARRCFYKDTIKDGKPMCDCVFGQIRNMLEGIVND
ncbi:MAG: hypothetical protein DRJ03_11630 [Chloroflexi bacterium]|nr:MAG: hypothetical protein DRJ03_11630 [Chloroflexota bacterium]